MPTAELPRLRNFRKIVTKDMEGEEADLQGCKVVVIVVEISPVLRAEVAQLCQLLEPLELIEKPQPRRERKIQCYLWLSAISCTKLPVDVTRYPCTTFGSLKAAAAEISNIMESAGSFAKRELLDLLRKRTNSRCSQAQKPRNLQLSWCYWAQHG